MPGLAARPLPPGPRARLYGDGLRSPSAGPLISPRRCEEEEPKPAQAFLGLILGEGRVPLQLGQKSQKNPRGGGPSRV